MKKETERILRWILAIVSISVIAYTIFGLLIRYGVLR